MKVLITNDDGVRAPGLAAVARAFAGPHQVVVVAPESEQSAVGHSITLSDPIRVERLAPASGLSGWAVRGTPADCVKLALNELLSEPVDMVISGINQGANVGVNLLYSGTVSAATEAAIYGLPAIAVSLDSHQGGDFTHAARVCLAVAENWPRFGLAAGVALNLNVPSLPPAEIKGLRITRQSSAGLKERFLRREDPRGRVYYWQAGERMEMPEDPELVLDQTALAAGYISLTPFLHRLTHRESLSGLARFADMLL